MFATTTTDIKEIGRESEKKTTMADHGNESFPTLAIIFLLAIIWMLTHFAMFMCAIVMILLLKIAATTDSSGTINNDRPNSHSPSQVIGKCLCRIADENAPAEPLSIDYQRLLTNREELEHIEDFVAVEQDSGGEPNDRLPAGIEQGITGGTVVEQNGPSTDLANALAQLPDSSVNQIDSLIANNETIAISIVAGDDSDNFSTNPVSTTTGTVAPVITSNTAAAPVVHRSPFVTENVMKIALSYSSEKRKRVLKIARILQSRLITPECPDPVFLDVDFQHEVCRLNGLKHLLNIYRQAQLVVVFLSPSYADSRYCTGEWRTIAQRFLTDRKDRQDTQLLLVKLDQYDMEQLGLVDNDFPINGLRRNSEEIAELIIRRWELVEKSLEQKDK